MASASGTRMSREDYKKAKELEELRKSGSAPPATDEDGKMINPHIPQYISQAPWYLNITKPGLKHQYRKNFGEQETKVAGIDQFYSKGKRKLGASTYQKGACENCGATTHKTKECCERPRKKGAKLTNQDIAPDEVIENYAFDYDGKRDRWRGFNPEEYNKQLMERFNKEEEARKMKRKEELDREMAEKAKMKAEQRMKLKEEKKKKKEEEIAKKKEEKKQRKEEERQKRIEEERKKLRVEGKSESEIEAIIKEKISDKKGIYAAEYDNSSSDSEAADSDSDSDSDSDADDDDLDKDMRDDGKVISSRDDKKGDTVRSSLRIREDPAKYLRNLAPNSAHYDPKTRSMRENPYPDKDPRDLVYAGDNAMRHSGDARAVAQLQRFVWDANEKGGVEDVNLLANPTQAELMFKEFKEKKEKLKSERKTSVLSKYGGEEHLAKDAAEKDLLLMQSEHYAEYSEDGKLIKGQEKAIPKTKYIEDVLENDHKSVWGSYYDLKENRWGYACCHQTMRNAYCTGEAGKQAMTAVKAPSKPTTSSSQLSSSSSSSSSRLTHSELPTEAELEEYRRHQRRSDDPMAKFLEAPE